MYLCEYICIEREYPQSSIPSTKLETPKTEKVRNQCVEVWPLDFKFFNGNMQIFASKAE